MPATSDKDPQAVQFKEDEYVESRRNYAHRKGDDSVDGKVNKNGNQKPLIGNKEERGGNG